MIGRAIVCGFVASVYTARALAAEVCVVCTGPDATYRCTTDQATKLERLRGGDRAQHYVCITALAKAGGHTKCRVSRDAGFCAGEARSVGPAELEAALGGAGSAADGPEGHEAAPKPAQPDPPQTVEELARRTTQTSSTGAQFEKASEAIGGAMKKSWLCITSLFTRC